MIEDLEAVRKKDIPIADRLVKEFVTFCAKRLLSWKPNGSILIELPSGEQMRFGVASQSREPFLKLNNYRVITKSLRRGTLGFAESFIDNDIECPNLVDLFEFFVANRERFMTAGSSLFSVRNKDRVAHKRRNNSRKGSRQNISEHYDLGNDFYRLWLDQEMNYSSALYETGAKTLEQAQNAKLDKVLEKLDLAGGEHILEIGCGWGAFAAKAAKEHGAKTTGLTLSHEQLAYAKERADRLQLNDKCDFRLEDYRDVEGEYDRIASIEMIEAVGEDNWNHYFETVQNRLKTGGFAVIQAITIDKKYFESYRAHPDFIQRYIFPGGMLPTPEHIKQHGEQVGLALDDVYNFGNSYAKTLREWLIRFEAAWPEIAKLGFDQKFRKKWRYYLEYCEAGFRSGMIDVGIYRLRKN